MAASALGACELQNRRIFPDGGLLSSGGGLLSPGGGLLQPTAGGCQFDPVSPGAQFGLLEAGDETTLATAMGLGAQTPDHYAILTAADGGNDKVGAGHMTTAISTPTFQNASTTLGINCTHMDANADGLECTSGATDWDVANESMAFLYVGTLDTTMVNNRYIANKGTTAAGYSIRTKSTGALECVWWFTGDNRVITISANHYIVQTRGDLIAVLMTSDRNSNETLAWSNLIAGNSSTAQSNDITNATAFRVGASIANTAIGHAALTALWTGTNGEGIRETNLTQLMSYIGLGVYDDVL